uniref:Cadherin N-terminal domain-containing protein n=1 Tax=Periophthalmus magnuspinnatus TaxID=409849 RepID=A0A3B4B0F9_9GOBI
MVISTLFNCLIVCPIMGHKTRCAKIYSITEEVTEGTIVGNVAKDLGLDKSALKDRKYRIVSGAAESLFHVDQKDGNLYVSRKIDREEVCEKKSVLPGFRIPL